MDKLVEYSSHLFESDGREWMNYPSPVSSGMLCAFCEQDIPDRRGSPYKCIKCSAKYCSKEHQKADLRFHHRRCGDGINGKRVESENTEYFALETLPVSAHLKDNLINSYDESGEICSQPSKQTVNIVEFVVDSLVRNGHCILDNFHGSSLATSILNEVKDMHNKGCFTDGQLLSVSGQGTSNRGIREDEITWVNGGENGCHSISQHMSAMDTLIYLCSSYGIKDHDIQHRSQAMLACYPGQGTGYKRHIDNPNKDGRCITTIYYLNPGWNSKTDGGTLKLMPEKSFFPELNKSEVEVEPVLDRLLLFWSDKRNPHEVMPAHKTRYAITLWYFDTKERKKFFEEIKQQGKQKPTSVQIKAKDKS
ncbi:prolyl hydroxylase EGLN3 isoform X2 [Nematostella vectensis]|uniref:prolyl hydroxylase EGLN3 isoform X2 n=1 Tax=Nematostella vectensis TaxID=45351 RepID=UPI00207723D5|nr:prolyl hydroxylase EGLN3 isoform X2 [Nematostella vectensis]